MIVTVTMNPAIDKTVEIGKFEYSGLNRIKSSISDAGGKGINVSKTIKHLGGQTTATGLMGGNSGKIIENAMRELDIPSDFVWVEGETRTNMKVLDADGNVTELNEPGPVIQKEAVDTLLEKLEKLAGPDTFFVLAGSIPAGVDSGIYGTIIERVKKKGAKVFLDADGELFTKALAAGPDYIKPNRFELEQYFSFEGHATDLELVEMGRKMQAKGIGTVAVSLGGEGALFVLEDTALKAPGLKVEAHSTVGAGDAMVAALSYGIDSGFDIQKCIRLGMATSAGAVTTIGTKPPTKELVEELMKQVELIEL
ncbi:MAG: 1-phosphofructokinase [Hespellia sp.]|nr:1-phosphofructokinase [Hespellia sp.]